MQNNTSEVPNLGELPLGHPDTPHIGYDLEMDLPDSDPGIYAGPQI